MWIERLGQRNTDRDADANCCLDRHRATDQHQCSCTNEHADGGANQHRDRAADDYGASNEYSVTSAHIDADAGADTFAYQHPTADGNVNRNEYAERHRDGDAN